jgi:hypothetical protein
MEDTWITTALGKERWQWATLDCLTDCNSSGRLASRKIMLGIIW